MSCIVTANINGNTIEIPIIESSADGDISSQSIQKLTELVKYIKSDEEIIHSLYTSEQNLELKKTNSDSIKKDIFSNTSIDGSTSIDVEKIKESFESLTKGIDIYTSNIDNDVQSLKIYNKKILIIKPGLIEHNGLKLLDALINLNVDNESVSNKIEKAKELFDKGIVESYTQYLYEQEVSQNIYLQDFASINVVKYKQSIEHKNVFYDQKLTSGSNPVPGDIIHKVIKQNDVETSEDYLYLGLSGEASNYHVLLKIVENKIDSSQIYIEKVLDRVLIYKPRLPYNYNFPTEHDIYTLISDQKPIPKNVKHSINKGDMIKSSNKRNAPTYVVIDIILNDNNDEEYLVYNPEEKFKYIKNSDEIKTVSQNSKLVFTTQEFIKSDYQTIINLENTDIAYNYFKLLKPDDVIELSDKETQYKIIQVNTDNTLQVISFDDYAERKKVKLEDVKKIYFKNYVKIDRDLNMLNFPLEFFKRSEYVSPFLNKFAKLHNYGISTNGSNVSFYELKEDNIEKLEFSIKKQVYDLGNYKKLDIPQNQILNELMVDDIIYKEDENIRTKKFYKVVSKVVTKNENDVEVIHVNVAMINKDGKYEIFELSQKFFNNITGIGRNTQENIKPDVSKLFEANPELANAVYEAAGFKNNYKDAAGIGNLIDELKKIEAPHLKELADLFISLNIDIPLYYSKSQEYLFVTTDNTLIIPKNTYGILKQKSIIHELLHAGTSNGLLSNSKFKSEIENLIKNIKDSDQQGRITFSYQLQNADEFISGLSEKSFVDFLKRKGIYDNVLSLVKNNLEFKKGFQITSQQKQEAQQLYSQYLDTIFPDSKVKDIVYHGTKGEKFENVDITKSRWGGKSFYVTTNKSYAKSYAKNKGNIIPLLIDAKNIKRRVDAYAAQPYNKENLQKELNDINSDKIKLSFFGETGLEIITVNTKKEAEDFIKSNSGWEIASTQDLQEYSNKLKEELTETPYDTILTNVEGGGDIILAVFEPEQIHILGSKQDIGRFKNWINDGNSLNIKPGVSESFDENPELANSGELTIYSKDFKRSSSFRKATQDKFISDTGLDRKIIQMLEDKFNIPVEIIDDINQAYAYTDGEKIFINIAKRTDDDNTYVLKHAVHEFVHLMLGNMRLNNPEDYRILIEVYKKHSIEFNKEHSNLNLNSGLQETEEELVTKLVDELGKLKNVGTELNFEEELLNKISKGFGDLFNISDIEKMKKTEWLSENVGSVIKKYKNDFAIMTSENFQLSQIKKHNRFLKEINLIKKEC